LRLLDLRLWGLRAASFGSRNVGLLDLRLRLGYLTAATIGVNTGIVGIHTAADDLVVAALIAGSYLSGAGASIAARAAHVVVIDATMDAVVTV
jgi:hypothetical protein